MKDGVDGVTQVSRLQDILDLNDHMQDKDFQDAVDLALTFLIAPDLPPAPARVAVLMTQLSAYATLFRVQFANYMGFQKNDPDRNAKKNVYKELYQGIDNLVDSLKYLARTP